MKVVHLGPEFLGISFWGGEGFGESPKELIVYLSGDLAGEFSDIPEYPLEERLALCLEGHLWENFHPLWWEYISLRRRYRKRLAFLLAHGGVERDGEWYFWDGDTAQRVQDWVDEMDGKFACLVIFSCNPGHITVSSRRSLLVIADRDVTLREGPGGYHFSLIDPKFGEIDEYTIEHRLAELRGKEPKKSTTT